MHPLRCAPSRRTKGTPVIIKKRSKLNLQNPSPNPFPHNKVTRSWLGRSSLSDSIKIRTASSEWPSNVHDLRPAILSAFISAKKFDLWVPSNRIYELPDASFLCEYLRCVGKLLENGYFEEANREALSWKPFLDRAKVS
jgi:hypothetical protein